MLEEFLDDKQKGEINIGVYLMYSLLTEDPIRTLDNVIYHYRNMNSKRKIVALASKFF
jgi:hypothetical protein